ncbi:MAG: glycosyltransferase [Candidatus Omnitrophica bacterium]|nr:glycosyltransferase [Candidatus Omnitrophota bacterium]
MLRSAKSTMSGRRILLMHVNTTGSGHYRASRAIEQTLRGVDASAAIVNVDAFRYASRFVRWMISRTYLSLIQHQPDIWEYLYDNPDVHRRVKYFQALLYRYHAVKLQRLIDTTRPDVIACTQAYPCGVLADFKMRQRLSIPLVGILTDYAPHLYWFHEAVDRYVVPSEQVKQRFIVRGVAPERVKVLGIPIDLSFRQPVNREAAAEALGLELSKPILLIMGGGRGLGQIRQIMLSLDLLPHPCQLVVLAGINRPLIAWLRTHAFRHRVMALSFINRVPQLMDLATLLVSKPGGMTSSEALAKRLPLVIVNPIPGQEAYNARYLLAQGAAVQAAAPAMVRQTVRDLLDNPERLEAMRRRAAELAHPDAAFDIASLLCRLADGARTEPSWAPIGATASPPS